MAAAVSSPRRGEKEKGVEEEAAEEVEPFDSVRVMINP